MSEGNNGYRYALAAFLMWGFFPIYFKLLSWLDPFSVMAHRGVWSLGFILIVLAYRGKLRELPAIMKQPRACLLTLLSGLLISSNWLIFIYAISISEIRSASLGYFTSPLVSAAIGCLILRERISLYDKIALALAAAGVAYQIFALGEVPLIAIGLSFTFGFYGYVKKIGGQEADSGFGAETLLLFPIMLGVLFFLHWDGVRILPGNGLELFQIVGTGLITALPLLCFAEASIRIPLNHLGLMNYITPCLQLFTGVVLFGEAFGFDRAMSFAFIWASLAIYTFGKFKNKGKSTDHATKAN